MRFGDGLFHEDVFALANGFLKMNRTETRRRRQDHDVGEGDGVLVGVEADEFVFFGHVDFVGVLFFEVLKAAVEAVAEGVTHGDDFGFAVGGKGLIGGAGAAAAAADEGDFYFIAAGRGVGHAIDGE
jgi:hypothetical protein